jgi:uncharacterized protein
VVLIDVSNVLHTTGVLPPDLAGPELADLGRLIAGSRYASRAIVLVCDGGRHHALDALAIDGLAAQVITAGPGQDADRVLDGLIAADSSPGRLLVVSTDRAIQRSARRRGATPLASDAFLRHLAADVLRGKRGPARPPFATDLPLDAAGTAYWMRYFDQGPAVEPPPVKPGAKPPAEPAPRRSVRAMVGEGLSLPMPKPPASGGGSGRVLWAGATPTDDGEGDPPPLDMDHWLKLFPPTDARVRKARDEPPSSV